VSCRRVRNKGMRTYEGGKTLGHDEKQGIRAFTKSIGVKKISAAYKARPPGGGPRRARGEIGFT